MCDPSNVGLLGGQRGRSIIVAFPGRQAGIEREERAQQLLGVERAITAIKSCSEQRTFAAGFQNSQPDAFARRQHAKW
jgi:hypothetical protein